MILIVASTVKITMNPKSKFIDKSYRGDDSEI